MPTQQEAHDALASKIETLKTEINAASVRVANAILAGKGEQVVDTTDLVDGLNAAISTVKAIEPAPTPTPNP